MSFMLAFNFNSYIPHFPSNAFNNGFYNNLVQDFAMLECVSYKWSDIFMNTTTVFRMQDR